MHQTNSKKPARKAVPRADVEARLERLETLVEKLSFDTHAIKGNLAANTALTIEAVDSNSETKALLQKIDFNQMADLLGKFESMAGGVRVLGWLERPAKWIAAVGAAVAVIYSLWNSK
jgi:HPt (histidine-containing phosphotransfer) domain-containing protein